MKSICLEIFYRSVITLKFNEAVKKDDLASVERFFKIFPLLGMHNEGLEQFALYLCTQVCISICISKF